MRLFIALNLPAGERKRIHGSVKVLREKDLPIRWVDHEHYHVTLKFLGEVAPDRLSDIQEALDRGVGGNQPFDLELGGFGAFPTIRRPKVLWLGAEASPALRCLKQDVEWALEEAGFDRDSRAFHPHVTLGRARKDAKAGAFRGLDELVAGLDYEASVAMRTVDLMRSRLSQSGPHYSVIRSSTLESGS